MALTDNILAYYKLNGDTTDEVGTNDGVDTSMTFTTGILGDAASFNGTNNKYSTLPVFSTMTTNFTVSFWVYRSAVGTIQVPLKLSSQTNFVWFYFTTGNNFRLVEDNIADYASSITISTTGTWNHIAVVKNGNAASNLTYYLNGSTAGTASIGAVSTPSGNGLLGAYAATTYPFNGRVDELGYWDRALTGAEITELYNGGIGLTYPFSAGAPAFLPRVTIY